MTQPITQNKNVFYSITKPTQNMYETVQIRYAESGLKISIENSNGQKHEVNQAFITGLPKQKYVPEEFFSHCFMCIKSVSEDQKALDVHLQLKGGMQKSDEIENDDGMGYNPIEEENQEKARGFNINANLDEKIFRTFSKSAPDWRIVDNGLNIEGKCQTDKCLANKKFVWIQKGYGDFDIGDQIYEGLQCPSCKKNVQDEPLNFGFLNCHYEILGQRLKPSKKLIDIKNNAGDGGVTTFKPLTANEAWQFAKLQIKTTKN